MFGKQRLDSERSGDKCLSEETTTTTLSESLSPTLSEDGSQCTCDSQNKSKPTFNLSDGSLCSDADCTSKRTLQNTVKEKRRGIENENTSKFSKFLAMQNGCASEFITETSFKGEGLFAKKHELNNRQKDRSCQSRRRSAPYSLQFNVENYGKLERKCADPTTLNGKGSARVYGLRNHEYGDSYLRDLPPRDQTRPQRNRSLSENQTESEPFLGDDYDNPFNRIGNLRANITAFAPTPFTAPKGSVSYRKYSENSYGSSGYEAINACQNEVKERETTSRRAPSPQTNYVDLNTRLDELVNHFQKQGMEYDLLRKSYIKLKKLFMVLAVVNIILIVCVIAVMPLTVVSYKLFSPTNNAASNAEPNVGETTNAEPSIGERTNSYNKTIIMETVFCVSCYKFMDSVSRDSRKFVSHSGDRCCFANLMALISMVINEARQYQDNLPRVSNSNGTSQADVDKISPLSQLLLKRRSLIHVKNEEGGCKKDGSWNYINWSRGNVVEGRLTLTEDSTAIRVTTGGYYFLYSRVRFCRHASANVLSNVTLTFYVSKAKNGQGGEPMEIEQVNQRCMFRDGTLEHESTLQTILLLEKEDRISVSIPEHQLQFLSHERGAHALGMFELY